MGPQDLAASAFCDPVAAGKSKLPAGLRRRYVVRWFFRSTPKVRLAASAEHHLMPSAQTVDTGFIGRRSSLTDLNLAETRASVRL